MSWSETQRWRRDSVLAASAGVPAAPSSPSGLAPKARQSGGIPTLGVGVGSCATRGGDLASPVDAEVERPLAHELFRRVAAPVARDVGGRHRHEMGCHAQVAKCLHDANRTEQIDLDGVVDRGVERHGRGRVDEDLARRERNACRLIEPEPVGAHVPRDHRDPPRDLLVEAVAEQLAEMVEGVVAQDLALHALARPRCGGHSARAAPGSNRARLGAAVRRWRCRGTPSSP